MPGPNLGQQLEHSGDRNVYSGELTDAKVRYGGAIDAYLDARDYEAAVRTCRKLIRLAPDVVRTHYTLAYLLVGLDRGEEARDALREYTTAVERSAAEGYAVPRLSLLAHVTDDAELQVIIGSILDRMGAREEAERVAQGTAGEDRGHAASARDRWERLMSVALRDNWP